LVQQRAQLRQQSAAVEQAGDPAEQIAQQVARSRLRGDVEHDLVEMHQQPEQIQIERTELEVKDLAGAIDRRDRQRDLLDDRTEDVPRSRR